MGDTNLSAVLYGKDDLRMEDRAIPEPGHGEVQIAMHSVGICGSDISFWTKGCIGDDFILTSPMLPGHESSGTVTKVGEGVSNLQAGDRVAIEPGITCLKCDSCRGGRYNLCPNVVFLSAPPVNGSLARYHIHAADFCFKLPGHVTLEEGAMLEPLSVAVHTCRRAQVSIGQKVMVLGAGTIGLLCMLTAKAMGAAEVAITDLSKHRLKIAKDMGANYVIHITSQDPQAIAKEVEKTMGVMPDITMECSGAQSSLQTGIYATKSGGVVMVVGLGAAQVKLPIVNAACREVDIRATARYANTYNTALAMIASGQVNVKPLVTHHFPLEDSLKAFETARTGADGAIKVVIDCFKN